MMNKFLLVIEYKISINEFHFQLSEYLLWDNIPLNSLLHSYILFYFYAVQ